MGRVNLTKGLLLFVIVFLCITILLIFSKEDLITGKKEDIVKIIVDYEPNNNINTDQLEINDSGKIAEIYEILRKTHDFETEKYPSHSESIQTDSQFSLKVIYSNGLADLIESSENPTYIYRHLNTKGSSGDLGFVMLLTCRRRENK